MITYSETGENQYEITFLTSSSYLDYKGCKYKYNDKVLSVGAKYGISIFKNAHGSGKITVEVDNDFYKIVVSGSNKKREILINNEQ